MRGRGFFRAGAVVSSLEEAVLSCQGEAASSLGEASPLVLLDPDQVASPLEDPSEAACQGADPSYLEAGLLCPLGAGLLVQVDTASGHRRCWLLLLPRQPCLCPVGSSPAVKGHPLL